MKGADYMKLLFIIVAFLFWFPQFIYVPVFSPYLESLGASYSFIGIILGSYGLTQLLFRLPIGILSDFFDRRKIFLIFGMIASTISCFIFLLTEHIGWILIARALAGVAAATWVVFTIIYPSFYEKSRIYDAMGSISFLIVLGQFIGMVFSGFIVSEWGLKGPFIISCIASFIGLFLSMFVKEPIKQLDVERKTLGIINLFKVLKDKRLLKISSVSIIAHGILFSTMFGFTSTYAISIGFSESELTWIVCTFMIPHAIATIYISKRAVLYFGEWKTLKLAFFLTALSLLFVPVLETQYLFLFLQFISGFSLGLVFPILLGMSIEKIEEEKRATAMGAYQSIYSIGIIAFPYLTGIVNSIMGIDSGFYLLGILGVFATILVIRWGTQEKKQEELKVG